MEKQPLVSVIVVSYNAEKTVLETLDSVLRQTYQNVELVLSDDCSKDNTVQVARKWFDEHSTAFKGGAHLLTAEQNQGVCANFNKAIRSAKGEWIKIIAADDILLPNCCTDYVEFSDAHPEAHFISSYLAMYDSTFTEGKCLEKQYSARNLSIFDKNCEEQLKKMVYQIFVTAPSMFFSKKVFLEVNGFNERYSYEDHPFYVNLLEHGYKLYFMPKVTAGYRVHNSMFNSQEKLFSYKFSLSSKQFRKECCFKYYNWRQKLACKLYYSFLTTLEKLHLNKKTKVSSVIYDGIVGLIWRIG